MRAPADRTPLPLDVVIRKVAAIAKVPDSELAFFSRCIHSLVRIACGAARRHELWQASDLKSSAKRIAVAARELEAALAGASKGAKELVRLSMPPRVRSGSLNGHGEMVAQLAAGAEAAAALRSSKPWILSRRLVVEQLLSDAKHAGGALSVTADGGTLFDALNLLFPYLPKDFEVSPGTIRRIARGSKKAKNGTK
jgi:hypothetical protein